MAIQDITFTILLTVLFSNYILIDSAKTIIKRNSGDDIIKYGLYFSLLYIYIYIILLAYIYK